MTVVLATTDGGATYKEMGRIMISDTMTGWKQHDIDLDGLANSNCLSIVFQAVNFDGTDQNIDRVRITADSDSTLYVYQDVSLDSIVGIDGQMQKLCGDTVWVSALVRNNSNLPVNKYTVRMELDGKLVVEDTVYSQLMPGDTMTHAMSVPYIVPLTGKEQPYYFLELSVNIPCDGDANNDSRGLVGVINVPDTIDLQVLSIAQPATDRGRVKVSPKVTVANIGNAEVQNVMLHVDVLDSAMTQLETVSEYINFINTNDTLEYAFSLTYTVPN